MSIQRNLKNTLVSTINNEIKEEGNKIKKTTTDKNNIFKREIFWADTQKEGVIDCGYCGFEYKYKYNIIGWFKHLAFDCTRVSEDRAWTAAIQYDKLKKQSSNYNVIIAHIYKNPSIIGSIIYYSGTSIDTTKEDVEWIFKLD